MTTNKQIIIDGKVKNCKILFECNSVDDLASLLCKSCDGNCEHKDILGIIRKAKGADNHG